MTIMRNEMHRIWYLGLAEFNLRRLGEAVRSA